MEDGNWEETSITETENFTAEKTQKHSLVLLLSLLLVGGLVLLGVVLFMTVNNNSSNTPNTDSGQNNLDEEKDQYLDEYVEAFWNNNDREKTREILDEAAEKFEANNLNTNSNTNDLGGEMFFKSSLANIAMDTDPEEGLRLHAEIFFEERYTETERADALFHAMLYVADKLRDGEPSFATAKERAFGPDSFGPILNQLGHSYEDIDSLYKLRVAALSGIRYAADMTSSYRIRGRILSVAYDLETALELSRVHQEITGNPTAAATRDEIEAYLLENPEHAARLDAMLEDTRIWYDEYLLPVVNNRQVYSDFTLEIIHALKNIMRTYNSFEYLGYDVFSDISEVYLTSRNYLNRFQTSTMEIPLAENHDLQAGVVGLRMACGHTLAEEEMSDIEVARYLAPLFDMSAENKARLSVLATISKDKTDACHDAIIYLGTINQGFQDFLVNDVGGWTHSQFTLTP